MEYFFDGKLIEPCHIVNNLGVDIDSSLYFYKHVDCIVAKEYSRNGLLFRSFVSHNLYVLKQACITFIFPLLEYASTI